MELQIDINILDAIFEHQKKMKLTDNALAITTGIQLPTINKLRNRFLKSKDATGLRKKTYIRLIKYAEALNLITSDVILLVHDISAKNNIKLKDSYSCYFSSVLRMFHFRHDILIVEEDGAFSYEFQLKNANGYELNYNQLAEELEIHIADKNLN